MFADYFQIKLGETVVKGRRLSIKETRQLLDDFDTDKLTIEAALKVIKDRCTLADGSEFDPEELSQDQVNRIICEMVLPEKGRRISDFIALLS